MMYCRGHGNPVPPLAAPGHWPCSRSTYYYALLLVASDQHDCALHATNYVLYALRAPVNRLDFHVHVRDINLLNPIYRILVIFFNSEWIFRIPKLHCSVFLALENTAIPTTGSQLHQINNFANILPIGHHQGIEEGEAKLRNIKTNNAGR